MTKKVVISLSLVMTTIMVLSYPNSKEYTDTDRFSSIMLDTIVPASGGIPTPPNVLKEKNTSLETLPASEFP